MTLRRAGWVCLILLVCAGAHGRQIALPSGGGSLKVERFDEFVETSAMPRLRVSGTLDFQADPAGGFLVVPRTADGSALGMRHYLHAEAAIRMFIYPNDGPTRFDAAAWQQLLSTRSSALGPAWKVIEEVPFDAKKHAGPPMLGIVSLQAEFAIESVETGQRYRQWVLLVPVREKGLVFTAVLWAEEGVFAEVRRTFRQFVSSMISE